MKKLMIPVLAALLLAGCGKDAPAPGTEPSIVPTTAPVTEVTPPPATTLPATEPTTVATEPSTAPLTEPTEVPTDPTTEPTTEPTTAPTVKFDSAVCQPLFGDWAVTMVMDGDLLALPEFEVHQQFDLVWQFGPEGDFSVSVDETAFQEAMAAYETATNDYLMEMRFRIFTAECRLEGLWEWATNQKWEKEGYREQNQAEVDAFIQELALAQRYEALLRQGQYYIRDGALVLEYSDGTEAMVNYAVGDGVLTLMDLDNMQDYAMVGIRPPLTLSERTESVEPTEPAESEPVESEPVESESAPL
ncbi:MAG: hypothetical protein IJV82_05940 [Oscillospiraceae bacterium]|nr:hypothetical protein [Oscillospiraceae bacterium]